MKTGHGRRDAWWVRAGDHADRRASTGAAEVSASSRTTERTAVRPARLAPMVLAEGP